MVGLIEGIVALFFLPPFLELFDTLLYAKTIHWAYIRETGVWSILAPGYIYVYTYIGFVGFSSWETRGNGIFLTEM